MQTTTQYEILKAHYAFTCPITGKKIHKGDSYADMDGAAVSLEVVMPVRKLRFIGRHK